MTISVEGVAIQEPKTKKILHQYPLHKISYCADDKAEKRFFSFISKDGDGKHTCFVFVSDKLVRKYTYTQGAIFLPNYPYNYFKLQQLPCIKL